MSSEEDLAGGMSDLDDDLDEENDFDAEDQHIFQQQVKELQCAVVEMKGAFEAALEKLSLIDDHRKDTSSPTEPKDDGQLAEALRLLITYKNELDTTQATVRALQGQVDSLEMTVRTLSEERDTLTHELLLSGALPARFRTNGSSDAPSSDSGVALLLERANAAFNSAQSNAQVSNLVHDYVATLTDSPDDDSECSLSLAAAKSLSLCTSLGQQCGLQLLEMDSTFVTQRLQVAKELLALEQDYCSTLQTMQEAFAQPLKASGIVQQTELNTLFPEEVWQLRTEHSALLTSLKARVSTWDQHSQLGDLLQKLLADPNGSDVLRLYTSYANAFPEVVQTFHRLCKASPAFTRFLKSCLQRPACTGLDLGALLLTPVQHMPRYVLLLRQFLQATPQASPEHAAISTCLRRLKDFLARLNDSMEHSFQLVASQVEAPKPQPSRGGCKLTRMRSKDSNVSSRKSRPSRSSSEWALTKQHRSHSSESELSSEECASPASRFCSTKSEPSLLSPGKQAVVVPNTGASSVVVTATPSKYVTLFDSSNKQKKKSFSLKNLLTFRKRCVSTKDVSKLQADSLKGLEPGCTAEGS
ncbi:Hypothetical predicted protein [Cloeon dipterum]|uniref:DH domain-containing protein n=1 Tax=Cloeon dipterum TaxID=197152 RepID=A0A8S1CS95_9INSE|nr:Hypothetical predicted protein [Cloeon dipterum]